MKPSLRERTLGFALSELDQGVHEVPGKPNTGPRIKQYLANIDPPIAAAAPWCAAYVQYCADLVAKFSLLKNPLDDVKLEAYVQSYFDWAAKAGTVVSAEKALPGDLVLYSFGKQRFDHIGFLLDPGVGEDGAFRAVEGNTDDEGGREGIKVAVRIRTIHKQRTGFIHWAE